MLAEAIDYLYFDLQKENIQTPLIYPSSFRDKKKKHDAEKKNVIEFYMKMLIVIDSETLKKA